MRWAVALGLLAGCGRLGFGSLLDARPDTRLDASPDVPPDAGVPGAVVHFELEDTAPGVYVDSAGAASGTCAPPNCPTAAPGHHGQGMHFDGVDDCIAVPDTNGYFSTQAITLAIWANQDGTATNGVTQFSKRVDVLGGMVRNSWQLEDYPDGSIAFTSNHDTMSNVQAISAAGAVVLGQWQHLAVSWDGATKRLYIDGALVATMPQATPIAYDAHDAMIGCDDNVGISEAFAGTLDDFVVYDRALSDAEIALLATL